MANVKFDKTYKSITINGSFDMMSTDTTTKLPSLVIDINGLLWDKFVIPESLNTSEYNKYEFSYQYNCPFYKTLKGKKLKLYFWNTGKNSMEAKNIQVSVKY